VKHEAQRMEEVVRVVRPEKGPLVLQAAALFGASNEIRLLHRGQEYRLRITKAGKLILTK
jgi:hemin uptake protein HemP